MRVIPLTVQTLYADLLQQVQWGATVAPGTIYVQTKKGVTFLYAKQRLGASYIDRYIGRADDPDAQEKAAAIRRAQEDARRQRGTVQMLRSAGLPAPSIAMGRVLEAVAQAGLFGPRGLVLIGTASFSAYAPVLGVVPTAQALITQDIDFALLELAAGADTPDASIASILRKAAPAMEPDRDAHPPQRFRGEGLTIRFFTTQRRKDVLVAPVPNLGVSAAMLPFLEYLIADPIPVVVLYGAGVLIRVPQPARYAVHKLIVADRRPTGDPKQVKDLIQASQIFAALERAGQAALRDDALDDANSRGPKWRAAIKRSQRGLDAMRDIAV
jgi:hypothetical protein